MSRPVIPPKIQLMSRPERVWRLRATLTNILGRGGRSLARPLFSGHAVHVSERPWRCWRRWTGIEPAVRGSLAPTALKAAEPTRYPDTSADETIGRAIRGPAGLTSRRDGRSRHRGGSRRARRRLPRSAPCRR